MYFFAQIFITSVVSPSFLDSISLLVSFLFSLRIFSISFSVTVVTHNAVCVSEYPGKAPACRVGTELPGYLLSVFCTEGVSLYALPPPSGIHGCHLLLSEVNGRQRGKFLDYQVHP